MINVALIERYPAICIGLRIFLEERFDNTTVKSFANFQNIPKGNSGEKFDIVILGVYERSENSRLSMLRMCQTRFPSVPIVVYGDNADPAFVSEALRLGLRGFLLREDGLDEVELCVRSVLKGKHYMNTSVTELFLNYFSKSGKVRVSGLMPLTEKESVIAKYLADGMRPGDIARELQLRPSTISTVKKVIFQKTKVGNIIDLKAVLKLDAV